MSVPRLVQYICNCVYEGVAMYFARAKNDTYLLAVKYLWC